PPGTRRRAPPRHFAQMYRRHKAVNQDIVPKIAIRCDDSAALLLFLWRRMWPIAAPKAAFRRRGENCAKPNGIRFCRQRVRAHAVWRRKLDPDVRQGEQFKEGVAIGLFRPDG